MGVLNATSQYLRGIMGQPYYDGVLWVTDGWVEARVGVGERVLVGANSRAGRSF